MTPNNRFLGWVSLLILSLRIDSNNLESDRLLELEAKLEKLHQQYEELNDAYLDESRLADERQEDLLIISETFKELKEKGIDVKSVIMEAIKRKNV
jgi:hypothetical protein